MKKALFIIIMSTVLLLVVGYGLLKLMNARSFQLLGELINEVGTEAALREQGNGFRTISV